MSRVALAPSRQRRALGRALDGDLCAARGCPARRTAPVRLRRRGHRGRRYGLSHRPAGAGQLTGVRRRARRASARQGAAGRRPTVGEWPTAPSACGHGGARSASHAFSLMTTLCARSGPGAGRLARRRRALETVEKVVTAPTMGVADEVIFVVLPGQATSSRALCWSGLDNGCSRVSADALQPGG